MPGRNKNNHFAKKLFLEAKRSIKIELFSQNNSITAEKNLANPAGEFYLLATNIDCKVLKKLAVQIESRHKFGRFFDFDIYNRKNKSIGRNELGFPPRSCLLCENPAKLCIRKNNHSRQELKSFIDKKKLEFDNYIEKNTLKWEKEVEKIAYKSIIREIFTTPKPGLVDLNNQGSHNDMDVGTFLKSSYTIKKYFAKFFRCGFNAKDNLFSILKSIGREAEKEMFKATDGVNTQKGIIFSFALIIAAYGRVLAEADFIFSEMVTDSACNKVKKWTAGLVKKELNTAVKMAANNNQKTYLYEDLTHGQLIYLKYGFSGARGEAESGFENVRKYGLPVLKKHLKSQADWNTASIQTLISLMSEVNDTNILYRSNSDILKKIKERAADIKKAKGILTEKGRKEYYNLIKYMESNSLSPGGSADLLAVSHLFYFLEEHFKNSVLKIV